MSSQYYTNVYSKRLNRYGSDYQSRIEGIRAKEFEDFLLKSPNRVDFEFDGTLIAAVLEQYQQDYSEVRGFLLTQKDVNIPYGTIIQINTQDGQEQHWMIWWLEQIKSSGYHRYVVLKMNYYINWFTDEGSKGQWSYFSTPGSKAMRDSVLTGTGARFNENNALMMFITPYNKDFNREGYLETKNGERIVGYRITEFDNQATPGISYLSVESIARKDFTPTPTKSETEEDTDFFWLQGGAK